MLKIDGFRSRGHREKNARLHFLTSIQFVPLAWDPGLPPHLEPALLVFQTHVLGSCHQPASFPCSVFPPVSRLFLISCCSHFASRFRPGAAVGALQLVMDHGWVAQHLSKALLLSLVGK